MPEIKVTFDAASAPPATSAETGLESKTTAQNKSDKQRSWKDNALIGMGIKTTLDVGRTVKGSVGRLSGSQRVQQNLDTAIETVGYAAQIGVGFAAGGIGAFGATAAVAVQIGSKSFTQFLNRKESDIDSAYNRGLDGYRIKGNR